MAQNSKIEWTNHTVNLWWGCTKVHAGCDHCYAETLSNRWGNNLWGKASPRKEIKSAFSDLDKYQRLAKKAGEVHRVFVGSMMDIFEKPMPLIVNKGVNRLFKTDVLRNGLFHLIDQGLYPNLFFLFLTKRASNIMTMIPFHWRYVPPMNIMIGVSISDMKSLNLLHKLVNYPGYKFISLEPQIESVDLDAKLVIQTTASSKLELHLLKQIHWVIQGGESGHHKRPFNIEWAREVRDICNKYNVPYFFKQIDKVQPIPDDLMIRQFPRL